MSQPAYGDNWGYGGGYGHNNEGQQYNLQGSYVGRNQEVTMENQNEMPPPPAAATGQQQQTSYYNPPPPVTGGWGSDMSSQGSSAQYYEAPRGQPDMFSGNFSQQDYQGSYGMASSSGGSGPGQMEVDQGSMGQIDSSYSSYGGGGFESQTFDEEPLLVELGIDLELIRRRTLSVLNPMQAMDSEGLKDPDLAGPLLFCLLFGTILLLSGKVHFGYIYGVGLMGCSSMYAVLNLMSSSGVSVSCVVSTLGYCLLPMVLLSSISIVLHLQGILGTVLSVLIIAWCSFSASKLFVTVLSMDSMQLLIAYPCALLYAVFALLTIF